MNYIYLEQISTQHPKESIKQLFLSNPEAKMCINNKWQAQLHKNKILQKLVKEKFLKQTRGNGCSATHKNGWKKSGTSQSYLVLAS